MSLDIKWQSFPAVTPTLVIVAHLTRPCTKLYAPITQNHAAAYSFFPLYTQLKKIFYVYAVGITLSTNMYN